MYKNYIQHRCRPILSEKLPKIGEAGPTLSENMVVDALNPVCSRLRRRPAPRPGDAARKDIPDQHPIHSEGPPQEDDTSGSSPKPMLSTEGQIAHLKTRGVALELCDEQEALEYLRANTYYYKLAAYRVLFPKKVGGAHDGELRNQVLRSTSYRENCSVIDGVHSMAYVTARLGAANRQTRMRTPWQQA